MTYRGTTGYSYPHAFRVYLSTNATNVTGAGASWPFGTTGSAATTTEFDLGGNISTPVATVTFTAPVDGYYYLKFCANIIGLTTAMTAATAVITATGRNYHYLLGNVGAMKDVNDNLSFNHSGIFFMSATDTATCSVSVVNGAGDSADILASSGSTDYTYFEGFLIM